jgi:hypothetical protein
MRSKPANNIDLAAKTLRSQVTNKATAGYAQNL